jgi:subtilisin-like proprotein convertase family protein/subtilisin family serine protease
MYLRTRTWAIISVVCLLGAWYFWQLGEERARREQEVRRAEKTNAVVPLLSAQSNTTVQAPPVAVGFVETNGPVKYRLRNTTLPLDELMRSDAAVLLRNALIDATSGVPLPIPPHLRLQGETKSYVVQSRGTITESFRSALKAAGAEIVSYVPNNAYLVRVSGDSAQSLRGLAQVQSVIAWEPHFKITSSKLLELAFEQKPLPDGNPLVVMAFPGEEESTAQALRDLGGTVLRTQPSPFGAQIMVHAPPDKLVAFAHVDTVHAIEPSYQRRLANDLSRTRVNVSTNTTTSNNHLGLTGNGVIVGLNDTGVDVNHPDLSGRVLLDTASTGIDLDGHGTHVAGTIASSGQNDGSIVAPGSVPGADFRGVAPQSRVFVQPIDIVTGPLKPDTELQAQTATNGARISNNSWGYLGAYDYTFAAASWDAAVRDSIPNQTGPQSVAYVFSAGNDGFGLDDGNGGFANTIAAPGTGKNVITVGATEQFRNITNEIVINGETNVPFALMTDSDNQVASFSSRGNIGPGIEGLFGRFKPDVVAPGVFVVSTRAANWTDNLNLSYNPGFLTEEVVPVGQTNYYFFVTGPNSVEARIRVLPNGRSPIPFPTNSIYVNEGTPPPPSPWFAHTNILNMPVGEGIYYIGVGNNFNQDVYFDIQVVVIDENPPSPGDLQLVQLNQSLGGLYRFESGTSMAAPVVSGTLALMQEFMIQRFGAGASPSPALMKALLINGARSIARYNLEVDKVANYQGWGLVNVTNSLPQYSPANPPGPLTEPWPVGFTEGALTTGESATFPVTLNSNNAALRITLVWTDPPGNPSVGPKLVNDLDLIVTNMTTGDIYVGNAISGEFNSTVDGSNILSRVDIVNNVENVYVETPEAGHTYSVTVKARRVNVNAVTLHNPRGVAQDFALVLSSGNPAEPRTFTVPPSFARVSDPSYEVRTLTNGMPILRATVGANPSLWSPPNSNGFTNQWRFYVFTNSDPAVNTNVAFFTFLTPNMARPRQSEEADIDLYVSTNPALTNLDASVIGNPALTRTSRRRGGTEAVVYTNANTAQVYYIGVKSEDQQAALFGLFGFAGDTPFSQKDSNGVVVVNGLGVPVDIPDGNSESATPVYVFGYCLEEIQIRNVVVTNRLTHQTGGDLFGQLDHNGRQSVLNNHRGFVGTNITFIYDDSDSGQMPNSTPTDLPGTLRNFWGDEGQGTWQLTMVDNALSAVGRVEALSIRLEPAINTNDNDFTTVTILPNRWFFTVVDVPRDAISLKIDVVPEGGDVDVFVGRNYIPDDVIFDYYERFSPPGGTLEITPSSIPPLSAGQYFIALRNPNSFPITVRLRIRVERDLNSAVTNIYSATGSIPLLDDAVTTSLIPVTNSQEVVDVRVGVRIRHERASDLVLSLVSPAGTRVILAENRGGNSVLGYGAGSGPDYIHTIFTEDTNLTTTPIKFGIPPFTNSPTPNSNGLVSFVPKPPAVFTSGFEDPAVACSSQLGAGDTVDGWFVAAGSVDLLCTGARGDAYFGQKWLELNGGSAGRVYRSVTGLDPTKTYLFSFAYSKNPLIPNAEANIEINLRSNAVARFPFPNSTNNLNWRLYSTLMRPPAATMTIGFQSTTPGNAGMYIDHVQLIEVETRTNSGNYFLPEESLRELRGENAYGNWRLDILDNRAQAVGDLLDWQVDFDFALPRTATTLLTHQQCFTNRIEGPTPHYFRVDVPINATRVTNTFSSSGRMILSADMTTLPTGFAPPDDYFVIGTSGTQIISTASSPPLEPGRPYFLALRNAPAFATNGLPNTNDFTLCVEFDSGPTNDISAVVPLTNNVCFSSSIEGTNAISYHMFDASSNAVAVFFNLVGLNGNADLFVKRGFPLPFPGNSLESRNTGTNSEHITVGSGPIPGRWFIGVLNNATMNVNYTLCVSEITNYVTVTDSLCQTNAPLVPGDTHYYRFNISNATGRAEFRTFNASGNIDLYVRRAPPASEFAFDYTSRRGGTSDENVVIDLLSTPVPLRPGAWYVAVVNRDPLVVTNYCIELNQYPFFDPSSIQLFITNGWTDTPPPDRYMDLTLIGPDYLRYWIEYSDTLTDDPASWRPLSDPGSGQPFSFGPGSAMYHHRDTPLLAGNPPGLVRMRFYRVRVAP